MERYTIDKFVEYMKKQKVKTLFFLYKDKFIEIDKYEILYLNNNANCWVVNIEGKDLRFYQCFIKI